MKSQLCPHQTTKEPLKADNKMLRAFGSTPKMIDQITKMTIYERSQFPIKGFPRTVKELTISGIGNSSMPIGILNLTNLSFLDLSKNQITKLHKSLGNLRLTKLVLSDNKFGESNNINDWDWMNGENIRRSLVTLNLSNNQLKSTPAKLFMFTELTNLDLCSNEISKLPHAIKQMKQLRIINLSKNLLKTFPYTITKLQLDSVDLSSNHLPTYQKCFEIIRESHQNLNELNYRAPTLLELAARQIIKKQIPFMHHNIPLILKDILIYSPLCSNSKCELLCFDMKILQNVNLIRLRANTIISSNFEKHFVADGPFCSRSCQLAVTKNLFRNN
jgi:LRR-repeat protein 1